jgi:sugar phosphate isomerase/epimerase
MDRRELMRLGLAGVAAGASPHTTKAAPAARLTLGAYSRTLHWLRSPEELAAAVREIGNTSIDLTVRDYPGHVQPERVKTDLPKFVETLRRNGVVVDCMAAEITDAGTPHVEAMLETAASVGIRHHWWRGFSLDNGEPWRPQIEDFKRRTEGLAKLEAKYGMKAIYHPGGAFSGGFYDLLEVCRPFDPRHIAIQYDTGNLGQINQGALVTQLRLGGPYIGGFVFKDFVVEKGTGPVRNTGAPPNPAGGPPGGRGVPAGNGWRTRQVPIGTGVVNLAAVARTLKEIGFQGPMECQPEWPELGGANQGLDRISISREACIALLRRDRLTVEAALAAEGLL